jgi:4-hydroxy-2-oxoheptanedioate aldolase
MTAAATLLLLLLAALGSPPSAQEAPIHLNPMIEKLAAGKPVFGVSTSDLSMENARALARADIDFVRVEMEHGPMDITDLRNFLIGMIDKETTLKQGNAQVKVAPIARFAPYGRENAEWVPKQALAVGLMGVMFNDIDDKTQALRAVRNMRYPQMKTSKYPEPNGLRGAGAMNAVWFWGLPNAEYTKHADLWPLNPQGDLLAMMMIESVEGLHNIDEIASVPGVGVIFPGQGSDLANAMGIPGNAPEKEAALQTILKSCKAHNVACGVVANTPADVQKRIKEGWKYIDFGPNSGLSAAADAAARAVRDAVK